MEAGLQFWRQIWDDVPRPWRTAALAVFGVGLTIRLVTAATAGVYVDEAYTYFVSRSGLQQILNATRPDYHPPLFYLLLHPIAVCTRNAFWLRLPSAVASALAVPVLFLVGRRLHSPAAGFWASAMLATFYTVWLEDAQMRAYGLMTLCLALGLWLSLEAEAGPLPRPAWALYAASCVTMPILHLLGAAGSTALFLAALRQRPRQWARVLWPACGLLLVAGWLAYSLTGPVTEIHARTKRAAAPLQLASALGDGIGSVSGVELPLLWPNGSRRVGDGLPSGATYIGRNLLSLVLWGLCIWGLLPVLRGPGGWVMLLALGVPLLLLVAGAALGVQSYQQRYLVPFASVLCCLLAVGALRARLPALLGVLVGVNLVTAVMLPFDAYLWNQDWRTVAAWVQAAERPGDVLAGYVAYSLVGLDYYYHAGDVTLAFDHPGTVGFVFDRHYDGPSQVCVYPQLLGPPLEGQLASARRVVLILNQEDDAAPQVRAWFSQRYGITQEFSARGASSWGTITVYVLERLP